MSVTRELHVVQDSPAESLPSMLQLDDTDAPCDVIDGLALAPFLAGDQPWARTRRLERVRPDALLRPSGSQILRSAKEDGRETMLAGGDGWTLRAVRWHGATAEVAVTAVSDELARQVMEDAVKDASEPAPPGPDKVTLGFWHQSSRGGPLRKERPISAAPWTEIRVNYAAAVKDAMETLMAIGSDEVDGRLVLLHGPPGTGKTTALRALARAWAPWCQADCVLDPERLFSDPGYLMSVAVGADDVDADEDEKRRWRLLILEDCDELIRDEAKQATGQALSRLLNLTDGLLGQGRDVLVAITTNEDVRRLHPAVVRPGRCLAQIEVGRLSAAEATSWLGRPHHTDATLAELFALRAGRTPVSETETPDGGFYL